MSIITQRDRSLFHELGKYGLLTTSQVIHRIFLGVRTTTVLRRLRALEKSKWIYRVKALDDGELVWILSRKGEVEAGLSTSMVKPNRNGVEHDVMLTELRYRLEGIGIGQNFVPEWAIRRQTYSADRRGREEPKLIPDGVFSATTWRKVVCTVAVELELHAKNLSRYEKIFTAYQEQSHLNFAWYFVKSKSFGAALVAKWKATRLFKYRNNNFLLFTVLSDFERNGGKALIHVMDEGTNRIDQFFPLPKPAQPPAQGVSTPSVTTPEALKLETAN